MIVQAVQELLIDQSSRTALHDYCPVQIVAASSILHQHQLHHASHGTCCTCLMRLTNCMLLLACPCMQASPTCSPP